MGWSVAVQYSCQDPSEEESIQISLLSRLQPFSSTSSTNLKGEAGKNAKSAVSIVLQFLRSYIFRLFWFNPQHGITMGLPTLREGHFLMPLALVVACSTMPVVFLLQAGKNQCHKYFHVNVLLNFLALL